MTSIQFSGRSLIKTNHPKLTTNMISRSFQNNEYTFTTQNFDGKSYTFSLETDKKDSYDLNHLVNGFKRLGYGNVGLSDLYGAFAKKDSVNEVDLTRSEFLEFETKLRKATQTGDVKTVRSLLEKGVDPHKTQVCGLDALWDAVSYQQPEVMKEFILHGAKLNPGNPTQSSVYLQNALCNNDREMATLLKKAGARISTQDLSMVLNSAIENNNLAQFQLALDFGADVSINHYSGHNRNPVQAAVGSDPVKFKMLKILVEKGADVNVKNSVGRTALFMACFENTPVRVVEYLLKHGADVNVKDQWGYSILQAAKDCNPKVADLLRFYGAQE